MKIYSIILFESQINLISRLTQMVSFLSCRATLRHLKVLMVGQGSVDFSLPHEVTNYDSSLFPNPINLRLLC